MIQGQFLVREVTLIHEKRLYVMGSSLLQTLFYVYR